MFLTSLLRRSLSPEQAVAVAAYRDQIAASCSRLQAIQDQWLDLSRDERDDLKLANAAAVFRWELARLRQALTDLPVPPAAAQVHRGLCEAFAEASRGCQLLAVGQRYRKTGNVCDGQVLLVESADAVERLARRLDDLLARAKARGR